LPLNNLSPFPNTIGTAKVWIYFWQLKIIFILLADFEEVFEKTLLAVLTDRKGGKTGGC
jgi:hypothetical protein